MALVIAGLLMPGDGAATDDLSAHLRRELQAIRPDTPHGEAGYAVKRAWDLVVLYRIMLPGLSPPVLSDDQILANLRNYRDAHAQELDPTVYALMSALLGEYDTATKWITKAALRRWGPICGNASDALKFGEGESRLYLDFIQNRHEQVTQADIVSRRTNGVIGVDVRSDRWCLLYGVAAAAHEALGERAAAQRFALQADSLRTALQSSWNYYYPADSEMLSHIVSTMRIEASRIRGRDPARDP